MNRDHLRSNGQIVGRNGHLAQVERKPKRVDYPRLLALGRELLLAIGEDPEREGLLGDAASLGRLLARIYGV